MIYRLLFQVQVACHLSVLYPNFSLQRTPAILQTNRRIYAEALGILYGEVRIILLPSDLLRMQQVTFGHYPWPLKIWRHDPIADPGEKTPSGRYLYRTPELSGDLYPHVFSRFQIIEFWAHIGVFTNMPGFKIYDFRLKVDHRFAPGSRESIDGDFTAGAKAELSELFGYLSVFEHLVKLISLNPTIRTLDIYFDVRVPLSFPLFTGHTRRVLEFLWFLSILRTTELFITTSSLDPLRSLDNVKHLSLNYDVRGPDSSRELNPTTTSYWMWFARAIPYEVMRSVEADAREGWTRSQNLKTPDQEGDLA